MYTKSVAKVRRIAVLSGLVGGITLLAWVRLSKLNNQQPFHVPFFGNAAKWPSFLRSFLPLDGLVACICFGLMFYLMANLNVEPRHSRWNWILYPLGVFLGCGSLGGIVGSIMEGWLVGLIIFVEFGLIVFAILGVLMLIGVIVYCLYRLVKPPLMRLGHWLSTKSVTRPINKFCHYMNADDIPD